MPSQSERRSDGMVELRVCVLNGGTPHGPLHLACADHGEAEQALESWSDDPELGVATGARVWIERRVIGPWTKAIAGPNCDGVPVVPCDDAGSQSVRCECGFAGTNVTPEALCGCCGKLVDDQSMRWLVASALANFKQKETS